MTHTHSQCVSLRLQEKGSWQVIGTCHFADSRRQLEFLLFLLRPDMACWWNGGWAVGTISLLIPCSISLQWASVSGEYSGFWFISPRIQSNTKVIRSAETSSAIHRCHDECCCPVHRKQNLLDFQVIGNQIRGLLVFHRPRGLHHRSNPRWKQSLLLFASAFRIILFLKKIDCSVPLLLESWIKHVLYMTSCAFCPGYKFKIIKINLD